MIAAVIAAAGASTRMGAVDKQLIKLQKKEVLVRTVESFRNHPMVDRVVVVVNSNKRDKIQQVLNKYGIADIHLINGGNSRQESVQKGLESLPKKCSKVLIHDGARPFVRKETITAVIDSLQREVAAIVGVASKDTIKTIDGGYVQKTLDRKSLLKVQTPQGFDLSVLKKAYQEHGHVSVTDDSALVERLGVPVKVIQGTYTNIKITTPEDIPIGERILEGQVQS